MAGDGTFKAKVVLKLDNCSTITPFSDDVEFEGLNGTKSFEEIVKVGGDSVCVDITSDCCHNLRLLALRPTSVRFSVLVQEKNADGSPKKDANGSPVERWEDESWKEVKDSGITRDKLASLLSFKTSYKSDLVIPLGRPQFYFDGLIKLLMEDPKSENKKPVKLNFSLLRYWLDADGNVLDSSQGDSTSKVKKKLTAVTVQFIAAYASQTPAPGSVQCAKSQTDVTNLG